jgi:predicted DNA-binding transcriptional regulator AlpA
MVEHEFLRLEDISPRRGRKNGGVGFLPLSRSSFLAQVKNGVLPQPIYLSPGVPMWRKSELLAAIEKLSAQRQAA